jgi:hypothetical protein
MIIDTLRPTVNYAAWEVTTEYTDMEDNSPIDFADWPNIRVELFDTANYIVMSLSRTNGVTTPVPGFIQWNVGRGRMLGLYPGTYRVKMYAWQTDLDDALPLMDSSVSVLGDINI